VHGAFGSRRRNENVTADAFERLVWYQKAVTVTVHVQPAGTELAAAPGNYVLAGTHLKQFAAGQQALEGLLEFRSGRTPSHQFAHKLFEAGAPMRGLRYVVKQVAVVKQLSGPHFNSSINGPGFFLAGLA